MNPNSPPAGDSPVSLAALAKKHGVTISPGAADLSDPFGLGRLAAVIKSRLQPSVGIRPGRPTNETWTHRPKIPMSQLTIDRLTVLAEEISTPERRVTAMQVAAFLLMDALHPYFRDVEEDQPPVA